MDSSEDSSRMIAGVPGDYDMKNAGAAKQEEEDRQKLSDMKNSILSQVLDQSARARLSTIALAKPDQYARIENMLLGFAQSGQLRQQLDESSLIQLLEKIGGKKKAPTVNFDRRRLNLDDSDEDE